MHIGHIFAVGELTIFLQLISWSRHVCCCDTRLPATLLGHVNRSSCIHTGFGTARRDAVPRGAARRMLRNTPQYAATCRKTGSQWDVVCIVQTAARDVIKRRRSLTTSLDESYFAMQLTFASHWHETSILLISSSGHHIQVLEATGLNCTKRVFVYVLDNFFSERVVNVWNKLLFSADATAFNSFSRTINHINLTEFLTYS